MYLQSMEFSLFSIPKKKKKYFFDFENSSTDCIVAAICQISNVCKRFCNFKKINNLFLKKKTINQYFK